MFNRIDFFGDVTSDGPMIQWTARNVSHEPLPAGSTHDYLLLFDAENNIAVDEKLTRQGDLAPGDVYEGFAYVQANDGEYAGYLTLDQDGDVGTIGARQRELRLRVDAGQVVLL
jgi:hypothetical protein